MPEASSGRRGLLSQIDVATLDQVAGHVEVVVLEEEDSPVEGLLTREVDDLADQVLAGVVFGMGLAGEEELQRAFLVGEERHESRDIVEEQVAALIGGEAAGEADGQRGGI